MKFLSLLLLIAVDVYLFNNVKSCPFLDSAKTDGTTVTTNKEIPADHLTRYLKESSQDNKPPPPPNNKPPPPPNNKPPPPPNNKPPPPPNNKPPTPNPPGPTKVSAVPTQTTTTKPSIVSVSSSPSTKPTGLSLSTKPTSSSPSTKPTINTNILTVSTASAPYCAKTNGAAAVSTKASICTSYKSILTEFTNALPSAQVDLANLFGQGLRLAFHDAGEIDITQSDTMGPDGCLSPTSDSAGLIESTSLVNTILEPIWQNHCDQISRADFWALIGKLVVETATPGQAINIPYQYGRKDSAQCTAGEGRLPSAQKGLDTLNQVFVTQMGLTLNDAIALLGAHSIGHVHTSNSGYGVPLSATPVLNDNAWDATPTVFDNKYYQNIIRVGWRSAQPDGVTKNLWVRPGNNEVFLNSDMAIAFDISIIDDLGTPNQRCGPASAPGGVFGCSQPTSTTVPSTNSLVNSFANSNTAFLNAFATAYVKMTTVGYGVPANIDGATSSGKLGTITAINLTTC